MREINDLHRIIRTKAVNAFRDAVTACGFCHFPAASYRIIEPPEPRFAAAVGFDTCHGPIGRIVPASAEIWNVLAAIDANP
jgi:hypothetical protein